MKSKTKVGSIKVSNMSLILAIFIFIALIVRIGFLALNPTVDGIDIQKFANSRRTREIPLKAKRGTIYDSNGNILGQDVSSYTLIAYLDPSRTQKDSNPQHVVDKEKTAHVLADILGMDYKDVLKYLSKTNVYQTEFGVKGRGLNEIVKDEIVASKLPGIDFIETTKRYYPYGDFASYLVGYAKTDENNNTNGELGVEKYFNNELNGTDGYTIYQKDRNGYKIAGTDAVTVPAQDGANIHLTIDNNVQFFVDEAINKTTDYKYESISIIVANAKTGAILGYATYPSFDPNTRNIKNYLDSNSSIAYEPGSTMKIYTYMAALEAGVYKGNATYKSGTFTTKDKTVIKDWNNVGWGYITYDKGFIYSSNTAVVNMLNKYLDAKTLKKYFIKLGFGTKTGVFITDINDTDNSMESNGKIDFKYETEIFNAGFGQGITTTPLQHIKALTAIANDGVLLKPYIIDKVEYPNGEVLLDNKKEVLGTVASKNTVDYMKNLMWHTINDKDGAGAPYAIKGYDLIGKTGTAQIAKTKGAGYETGESAHHRSIALMFPKDDPQIIIYGVVKRSSTSTPLSKAAKEIVVNVSKYYDIYNETKKEEEKDHLVMGNYLNQKTNTIISELKKYHIKYYVIGDGDTIINQYPNMNQKLNTSDKVFLVTNSELKMLDLTGFSASDVKTFCSLTKIHCTLTGNGYVNKQSILKDEILTSEANLEITLSELYMEKEAEKDEKQDKVE